MSEKKRLADEKLIIEAVARGWCHKATSSKEFDSDLALAISEELKPVFQSQILAHIKKVLEEIEVIGFPTQKSRYAGDLNLFNKNFTETLGKIRSRYGIKG